MAERETATITSVEVFPEASSLMGDHAAGVSVLNVADGRVFGSDGTLRVGTTDYAYDRDDLVFSITPPLVAAASDGDPVLRIGSGSKPESRKVVYIDFDGDGLGDDEAEVRSADRGFYPEGDALAGVEVDVVHTPYGYETIGRPYEEPSLDPSFVGSPMFKAQLLADVSIAKDFQTRIVNWTPGLFDITGYAYYSALGELQVLAEGTYLVSVVVKWVNNTSGRRSVKLLSSLVGVSTEEFDLSMGVADNGSSTLTASVPVELLANSTLRVEVFQNSGAALGIKGDAAGTQTFFRVVRLR